MIHTDLDKETAEALEQRFLKHGTLVITQEGVVLQATKVRGSKATREIYFAASESSAHAVVKAKPSEVFASDSTGGFSHVFMNVLGQEFTARAADGAADPNHGAMTFAVAGLVAGAKEKAVQSVRLVAVIGGTAVGEPIEVEAGLFLRAYLPYGLSAGAQARLDGGLLGVQGLGSHDMADKFPTLFQCLSTLGGNGNKKKSAGRSWRRTRRSPSRRRWRRLKPAR